jgi:hypothetical protein
LHDVITRTDPKENTHCCIGYCCVFIRCHSNGCQHMPFCLQHARHTAPSLRLLVPSSLHQLSIIFFFPQSLPRDSLRTAAALIAHRGRSPRCCYGTTSSTLAGADISTATRPPVLVAS